MNSTNECVIIMLLDYNYLNRDTIVRFSFREIEHCNQLSELKCKFNKPYHMQFNKFKRNSKVIGIRKY